MHVHEDNAARARLIGAAKAEFLRCGYAKASLRTIAREAGVSTGSVYFFFGSKRRCSTRWWTKRRRRCGRC